MEEELTTMSSGTALLWALGATAVLVVLHLLAPRVRTLPGVPDRVVGSFAGGIAIAYVFLHLLPELAEGNEGVGEVLSDVIEVDAVLELSIFLVALTGFTVLYGLERLAERSGSPRARVHAGGGEIVEQDEPPPAVFWLHLATFSVYNALITYSLPLRFRTGMTFALLFVLAMALHFVLTDRSLEEHYPRRFSRWGRFVLAGALLLGWVLAVVAAPTSTVVVTLLTALLGGGILLNVFKEELPGAGTRSSYPWFLVGLVLYAALLTSVTVAA